MKILVTLATLADCFTRIGLMLLGYVELYNGNILNGCALICTATFYKSNLK